MAALSKNKPYLDLAKSYHHIKLFFLKGLNMAISKAYEEVIDFIAEGTTPDSIIAFQPSEAAKQHVADLIRREKLLD